MASNENSNNKKIDNSILLIKEIGDNNNIIIDEVANVRKIIKLLSFLFLNSTIKTNQKNDTDFQTIADSINYIENELTEIINNLEVSCDNNKTKIQNITPILEEISANIKNNMGNIK